MIDIIEDKLKHKADFTMDEQELIFARLLDLYINKYDDLERYYANFNVEYFLTGYVNYEKSRISDDFLSSIENILIISAQQPTAIYSSIIYFIARFLLQKERFKTVALLCQSFLDARSSFLSDVEPLTLSYIKHFALEEKQPASNGNSDSIISAQKFANLSEVKARLNLTPNFIDQPLECMFSSYKEPVRHIIAKLYYEKATKI